ncbi:hypothetical protein [Pelosinus sp. UFO1]|uniref:hypothetical protein n=1 Tax=Pelosinus sp. UFO1 TaxID=484770 RepID=UPI0004D11FE0|nr:hypothetical protein [Pelosinus sp. UFO1]AIF51221.1 hypothetical protein UFO1_1670 [Pelosinus sp. UFO1]
MEESKKIIDNELRTQNQLKNQKAEFKKQYMIGEEVVNMFFKDEAFGEVHEQLSLISDVVKFLTEKYSIENVQDFKEIIALAKVYATHAKN